ncbi:hypothetical protein ACF0H5_024461 [Mactra antiquata]
MFAQLYQSDVQETAGDVQSTTQSTNMQSTVSGMCTSRRYVVFLLIITYFLAGGIFAHQCPQYTQHRMAEHYRHMLNDSTKDRHSKSLCHENKTDPSYIVFTHIQQDAAKWSIFYPLASKLPALVTNIVLSTYSDVLGRRLVFIICLSGATARILLFTLVIWLKLSLSYIVLGCVIDGLTGSFTTFFAALYSYISDITLPDKQRTIFIVLSELIRSIVITCSSIITGNLISQVGFFIPALVSLFVELLGLVVAICFLPETVQTLSQNEAIVVETPSQTGSRTCRCVMRMLGRISETLKFYIEKGPRFRRRKYILLILGFLFFGIPGLNRSVIETLYLLGRPFCWSSDKIGWFHAAQTAISASCAMIITYAFRKYISDQLIATISVVCVGVSYIIEGVANNEPVFYSVTVLTAVSTLPIPMIRSLMSSLTPQDKQGALNASIGFVEGICALVGAASNNTIYSTTMTIYNGFVFFLMSALTFPSAVFLISFIVLTRLEKKTQTEI